MIEKKYVVRMRVPFPNVDSGLAVRSHMYICIKNGAEKEFVKCQSFKPTHLLSNRPPYNYIVESPNIKRNPFKRKTTIDCDKSFHIKNVIVDQGLVTSKRKDICKELFADIMVFVKHDSFIKENINETDFLSLNRLSRLIT